jgi:DNA-binding transcriptional LysR family regulator
VPIDIEVGLSRNLLRQLHDDRLDVILAKQPRLRPSGLESVWDENLIWVAGHGFRPEPDQPVPLVVFGDDCLYRRSAIQSLSDIERPWRIAATCSTWTGIRASVAAGVGYTITSRRFPLEGLREAANDEGLPTLPNVTVLLMRGPRSHTAAGDCLSTILREAAQAPAIH